MSAEKKEESKELAIAASTPLGKMKQLLKQDQTKKRFEEILREKAPQFMASITNQMAGSYQLQKCAPESIIAAAFIAAALDLPIDKNLGYAWIIPYGNQAQFQMGWKGYVQLALRSGCYSGINAFPVNEEARGRFDPRLKEIVYYDAIGDPVINFDKLDKTKPAVGYGCAWKLTTGFVKVCYWSRAEVLAHAERYSQAVKSGKKDTPWATEFDKMALKTVLSNSLRRWGIMSIETRQMQEAMRYDQSTQDYIDAEVTYPDGNDDDTPKETEGNAAPAATGESLTDQLKAKRESRPPAPEVKPPTDQPAEPSPQNPGAQEGYRQENTEPKEPAGDGGMAGEDTLRAEVQAKYDKGIKTAGKSRQTKDALKSFGVSTVGELAPEQLPGALDALTALLEG